MVIVGLADLSFFFFNDTATTEIYTLSLHDALPICIFIYDISMILVPVLTVALAYLMVSRVPYPHLGKDRKSTRLNSSHKPISYAVFCLKKKKTLYTLHAR